MKIKNINFILLFFIIETNSSDEKKYTIIEVNKKIESGCPFTNEEYQIYASSKYYESMNIMNKQGKKHVWSNLFWISYSIIGWIISLTKPTITKCINQYSYKKEFKNKIQRIKQYSFGKIIGYEYIKKQLIAIIENIHAQKNTKCYKKNDGVIFYGPPGCGKTNFVYAIAHETNTPVITIAISDLINDKGIFTEKFDILIKSIKEQVDNHGPCILFFDEFDFFVGNRKNNHLELNTKIIVQTFLNKLSNFDHLKGVFIFACTNDIQAIDEALLRNGRFGIHIEIPLPNEHDINLFYNKYCANNKINSETIIQESKGLSCAALISKFSILNQSAK